MKTFRELREARKPKGKVVYDKKVKGIPTMITKDGGKYTAHVDGDEVDTFRKEKDAKDAIDTLIKELT